jgi:hypothetical protein
MNIFKKTKLKKQKAKIIFILEKIWIIEMLFGKEKYIYDKLYQQCKRKTKHALYTNY